MCDYKNHCSFKPGIVIWYQIFRTKFADDPLCVIKDQKYENPREIFENPDPVAQEKPALQIWTPNSV